MSGEKKAFVLNTDSWGVMNQFEISGIANKALHSAKIPEILVTLFVSHLERSGIDFKEEQLKNKKFIFLTFFVFHFEIFGKNFKDEQL